MHVAWASALRVVLLAGPQHAGKTGPWSPGGPHARGEARPHRVVRAGLQPECAPCFKRSCDHAHGNVCMSRIEPLEVARVVRTITLTSREPAAV